MHCTTRSLLTPLLRPSIAHTSPPPSFLAPALSLIQFTSVSTSSPTHGNHDRNRLRGLSALRHTGLRKRQTLSVNLANLPKPVLDPQRRSAVDVDPEHGLWDFFNEDRTALITPKELEAHGRAWMVSELRRKDWDDLWRLWWSCVKERNRIETFLIEKERVGKLEGGEEAEKRVKTIKKTMKAIRHTLTERWYAWDNARYAAMEDPEVNLYAAGTEEDPAYIPLSNSKAQPTIADAEESDAQQPENPESAAQQPDAYSHSREEGASTPPPPPGHVQLPTSEARV